MKLNKTIGSELYTLFGPNGHDFTVSTGEKNRMNALKELERHGLVKLVQDETFSTVFHIRRQTRGLVG